MRMLKPLRHTEIEVSAAIQQIVLELHSKRIIYQTMTAFQNIQSSLTKQNQNTAIRLESFARYFAFQSKISGDKIILKQNCFLFYFVKVFLFEVIAFVGN